MALGDEVEAGRCLALALLAQPGAHLADGPGNRERGASLGGKGLEVGFFGLGVGTCPQ